MPNRPPESNHSAHTPQYEHDAFRQPSRWTMADQYGRFAKAVSPLHEDLPHQLLCQGNHWRKSLPIGVHIGVVDWEPAEAFQVKMEHITNVIVGIALLQGHATLRSDGVRSGVQLSTTPSTLLRTIVPEATLHVRAASPLRAIYYHITPKFIQWAGSDLLSQLPSSLQSYFDGGTPQSFLAPQPLTPQIEMVARQIIAVPYSGALAQLYLEAKAVELLTLQLGALQPTASHSPTGLTSYDVECLHHAKVLLEQDFQTPPSLAQLAHAVGINQNKLKQGFRALFKITPFAYVRSLRLRHARDLLEATELSIQEIASIVGYRQANNFTAAFRAEFGLSPRSYRRNSHQ